MSYVSRIPFRRRTFFVKGGFQLRFALYPVCLLLVFLLGAGFYLHSTLREMLQFQLYLPHSRLQNPWHEILPALIRVAAWGGAGFLAALTAWGWRRFARLRKSLDLLATWIGGLSRAAPTPLPPLAEQEVSALGRSLLQAARAFESWDEEVASRSAALVAAVQALEGAEGAAAAAALGQARSAWRDLAGTLGTVRVDEGAC